jgi:hypothetical protein
MSFRQPSLLCTALSVLFLCGCSSATPAATVSGTPVTPTQYSTYTQSFTIPWVGSPDFTNLTSTLQVSAQVNGGATKFFTVDTGSVGVVLPASDVPNIPANSPAGSLTYTSSGLELIGVWATLPMTFPTAVGTGGAASTATATVPVLAVTSSVCTGVGVNSGSCTGAIPHQLGIGFGRGTSLQNSPPYNPTLNLTDMVAGTMRRGYVIDRTGLHLGLTASNVSTSFVTQTLTSAGTPASGTHTDWDTPTGGFVLGSGTQLNGTVLMDTGLLDMILEDSSLPSSGSPTSGTAVKIIIGSHDYIFNIADGGDATPTSVQYAIASHGTFVNTGLRALAHYDLMYDADGGLFGLWYVN